MSYSLLPLLPAQKRISRLLTKKQRQKPRCIRQRANSRYPISFLVENVPSPHLLPEAGRPQYYSENVSSILRVYTCSPSIRMLSAFPCCLNQITGFPGRFCPSFSQKDGDNPHTLSANHPAKLFIVCGLFPFRINEPSSQLLKPESASFRPILNLHIFFNVHMKKSTDSRFPDIPAFVLFAKVDLYFLLLKKSKHLPALFRFGRETSCFSVFLIIIKRLWKNHPSCRQYVVHISCCQKSTVHSNTRVPIIKCKCQIEKCKPQDTGMAAHHTCLSYTFFFCDFHT